MQKAEYDYWLKRAKDEIDLESILKCIRAKNDIYPDYKRFVRQERAARSEMASYLIDKGYADIEDFVIDFGHKVQEIYMELGIIVGARLVMDDKLNSEGNVEWKK